MSSKLYSQEMGRAIAKGEKARKTRSHHIVITMLTVIASATAFFPGQYMPLPVHQPANSLVRTRPVVQYLDDGKKLDLRSLVDAPVEIVTTGLNSRC